MATTSARLLSLLRQLPFWWHNRSAAMQALDELDRCPASEVARTASDFGTTVQDLKSIAGRGPISGRLFATMARTYGLEPAALRRAGLNLVREMEERCMLCGHKLRCAVDLADGDGVARAQASCPNAEMLKSIARH